LSGLPTPCRSLGRITERLFATMLTTCLSSSSICLAGFAPLLPELGVLLGTLSVECARWSEPSRSPQRPYVERRLDPSPP
jgi:hypothetical protein